MKKKFYKDLEAIYKEIEKRDKNLNNYYKLLKEPHKEAKEIVDSFLKELSLPKNEDSIMAALMRIVNLREDFLTEVLKKEGLSEKEIIDKKERAYLFVSSFHIKRHKSLIDWIEENSFLTPFYRELIKGAHEIGVSMSGWQSSWTSHIINGINRELLELFERDEEKIFNMLFEKELLDLGHDKEIADRCYSVLKKDENGEFISVPYSVAFREEVKEVSKKLTSLIKKLEKEEDFVFHKKEKWIEYLKAIKRALLHEKRDELVSYWADVDRKWMEIDTPIQIGHPLEYYEDRFKKAVALEWDVRVVNPKLQESSKVKENIKRFAENWIENFKEEFRYILEKNLKQINRTQLYISRPMLYYGAEFNGLFSAQVVPNDEKVSSQMGKKIFAFADFVRESKLSKPIMLLSVEIMGEKFIKEQREILEKRSSLWYKIYEISTIGHEFGHILWIDSDTESKMNKTGQFKNIEEFKATTGGLQSFFYNEEEDLKKYIVDDLIQRSISLVSWMEVEEVLPYYLEGLIHLDILFSSKIISFDKKIKIDYSKYEDMKNLYNKTYKELTKTYLYKEDAANFLNRFAKKENNLYFPIKQEIKEFVEYYYNLYKRIGQKIFK